MSAIERPDTVHGRLMEAVHISGYSLERALSELEWLLDDDRWKSVGGGYTDINAFLATIDFSSFRIAVKERKKLAKRLETLEATAGATARMLGVSDQTIYNDTNNLDRSRKKPEKTVAGEKPKSNNLDGDEWFQDNDLNPADEAKKSKGKKQRQQDKQNKKHDVATAAFSDVGPFGTVVIDPPWEVEKIDRDVRPKQAAFDYPTMSFLELQRFFIAELAPKLEDNCHLFMWTTQKWMPSAIKMLDTIGFKYVLTMVWHKAGGFQPTGLPQYNCEFVIYARRGAPVFIDTKDFPCCFDGERREHSRKPERFYEIVKRVTGGSRIDVFSREARDGFAQFGNETARFSEAS